MRVSSAARPCPCPSPSDSAAGPVWRPGTTAQSSTTDHPDPVWVGAGQPDVRAPSKSAPPPLSRRVPSFLPASRHPVRRSVAVASQPSVRYFQRRPQAAPSLPAPPCRRWPKSSTSRRHSRRRAWACIGRLGRCRVAGPPPSRGAPSLGGRGDHLGSPRGRVGRPIRLLAGGRRRLRDFGRPRRLQPGRAAPAGSWGRRAVGPIPCASRGGLSRGVKVGRVSVCSLQTGSGREPAGPAEAVCPSTVDPVMA
mmetsp:Transcript_3654/g.11769  ORF Transcript_3654/g.11769 Transcript_3654/m.11769 type:complete len:251 (+) Transcript_3654:451-1203(+)